MFKRGFRFLFVAFVTVFFVAFSIANREMVGVSFAPLPYVAELPLFLLAIACFALGTIVAWLMLMADLIKSRRLYSKEQKRAMALENEVKALQSEPFPNIVPLSIKRA